MRKIAIIVPRGARVARRPERAPAGSQLAGGGNRNSERERPQASEPVRPREPRGGRPEPPLPGS